MEDPRAAEPGIVAEEWIDETLPVDPGGTLWIDLDRGHVEVTSHDADTVRVVADARGWASGLVTFTLERHGPDVELDGSVDGWFPAMLGRPRITVRAWIPRRYSVEIETRGGRIAAEGIGGRVGAQTSGGRVEIAGVDGPVLAITSGGRIQVEALRGDLRARTSGGPIRIEGIEGDVECRTGGGGISIVDAGGDVDARTSGGSIRVAFSDEPSGRLETTGGSIQVELPGDTGAELDAHTTGGSLWIDPEIVAEGRRGRRRFRGTLNGGGRPLDLRTSGGSIRIRSR